MMAETNPTSAFREVKIEDDRFEGSAAVVPNMGLEKEVELLVRERDPLKKEVCLLERIHKYMESQKSSVEEKLQSSNIRCERLEEDVGRSERKRRELKEDLGRSERKRNELEEDLGRSKRKRKELEEDLGRSERKRKELEVEVQKLMKKKMNFKEKLKGSRKEVGNAEKGGRNLVLTGTENDGANADAYHDLNVAEGKGTTLRITRLCNLFKIIGDIKMNLEKEILEKFEHSCFGDLLKTNEFTFQGQLIVQLLMHLDLSASNKERLVFKINNSSVEFGPCDFFRITGLRLGNLETATTSLATYSTIHQSVFGGRPAITLKEIEEAFLRVSTSHEGKGEVTLKLALLYFVYGTLLAKPSNCKIELLYLHLIEDLEKFNTFPWGQLAYEYLVSSILEARFRMDAHPEATLIMQGFCDALQAWAYEMMPAVAAHCASRANNIENLTPRILRWSATKVFRFKDLKKFFALADLKNTKGKKKETVAEEAKQKRRKFLCEDRDQTLHTRPSSTATPPPPLALTHSLHQCTQRLSFHREVDEPVQMITFPGTNLHRYKRRGREGGGTDNHSH